MKTLSITCLLLCLSFVYQGLYAESKITFRQSTCAIDSAIINASWVLEANQIICKCIRDEYVEGQLNFISISGEKALIQVGKNYDNDPSYSQSIINGFESNHVGGLTISGEVANYRIKERKNGNRTVFVQINSVLGSVEVVMDYNKGNQTASAFVKGNSFMKVQYIGDLLVNEESCYYAGRDF